MAKKKDMAGVRMKAPSRPYYGELEPGETWPPQKKMKPAQRAAKNGVKKTQGMGKKVVKEAKSAMEKRREAHRKILESMD